MILVNFWIITIECPIEDASGNVSSVTSKEYTVSADTAEEAITKIRGHFSNKILSIDTPEDSHMAIVV
jgi:hypothetical protein